MFKVCGIIGISKIEFFNLSGAEKVNWRFSGPGNLNFESKMEKIQYKACIAIIGAIQGTSRERLYDELGLMSLSKRRWYNRLTFFYKIVNGIPRKLPSFLYRIFF